MSYKFEKNPPLPIDSESYRQKVMRDFQRILKENGDNEKIFQDFFEQNPSLVPGSKSEFEMYGSGHGPLFSSLITQPKIEGLKERIPDFLWLSYDSVCFCPVFIEIEAPNKKYFNQDGSFTSDFNKAREQLIEWKTILGKPLNIEKFKSDFNIPREESELYFDPYFVLIYGRREEFENNRWKRDKRSQIMGDNRLILMSYDRIEPKYLNKNYLCCEVKSGDYYAKYLTPTFKVGPYSYDLLKINNIENAIKNMVYTSEERKRFLLERIPYWINYIKNEGDNDDGTDDDLISFDNSKLDELMKTEE